MTMKKLSPLFALLSILLFFSAAPVLFPQAPASTPKKPNIIFIMADDLGYGELGCYGQKIIMTPSIDRIAKEGIKFTDFYSGQAVCAPARCTLMTGYHTGHSYIRDNGQPPERNPYTPFPGQNPIPDDIVTVAELLKEAGYTTGCIGKWGLGNTYTPGDPVKQGFDFFYGYKCQVHAHNHYPEFLWENDSIVHLPGNDGRSLRGAHHSQDLFTVEAVKFINRNQDNPFFLYLPFIIPHLSIQTTDLYLDMYKGHIPETPYKHHGYLKNPYPHAAYAGMITQMDAAVGLIMETLKGLGLDNNTIVFFTSDNGPAYNRLGGSDDKFFNSAGGLTGLKGSLHEGGIREPLVVRWPGKIKSGKVTGLPSALWDVLPTLCDIAGIQAPQGIDGISFFPTLTGTGKQQVHDFLYWEFRAYGGQAALRMGDWKLLITNLRRKNKKPALALYNLKKDPAETTNLAEKYPKKVQEGLKLMQQQHTSSRLFPFPELEKFVKEHLEG